MKLNKRKGFTVVELVIVIAIIAVLAAVLIPTFAGLVRKANISKDTQLVRNLNTALATATEKPKTMYEALQIAADAGYLVDKINASATSNEILYDSKNNVFCYYNATNPSEGSVEYIPESAQGSQINNPDEYYLLWKIYDKDDDIPAAADQKFSVYLADDAKVPADGKLTVSVGFDAGDNTKVSEITYKKSGSSNVIIRTNGGNLVVDAGESTIKHYGCANYVNIIAVATSSYHEYGIIAGNIDIAAGHIVVEENGKVNGINITSNEIVKTNDKYNVSVSIADNADVKYITSSVALDGNEDVISKPDSVAVIDTTKVPENAYYYNLTEQSYRDPDKTENFYRIPAEEGDYFILLKDISGSVQIVNSVTIDLNGHSIKSDSTKDYGALRVKGHAKLAEQCVNVVGSGVLEMTGSSKYTYDCALSVETYEGHPANIYIGEGVVLKGTTGIALYNTKVGIKGVSIDFAGKIEQTGAGAGIYVNGTYQDPDKCPEFVIRETASIVSTGEGSTAIYAAGYANWTIEGGYFEGRECVEIKAGNMVIKDGTFVATGEKYHEAGNNGASAIGYSLAVVNNNGYAKPLTVSILGGTFKNDVDILEDQENSEYKASLTISGGVFVNDVSAYRKAD